jgi:hypothetical protein
MYLPSYLDQYISGLSPQTEKSYQKTIFGGGGCKEIEGDHHGQAFVEDQEQLRRIG